MTEGSSSTNSAWSANPPIQSLLIKGGEVIRAWQTVAHLPDCDVIFMIMNSWTPDEMDCFMGMMSTRAMSECSNLRRGNFPMNWEDVINSAFVARAPVQISRIMDDLAGFVTKMNLTLNLHPIVVNGVTYKCHGRDGGGALLLFNLLSLGVSEDSLTVLKHDIHSRGKISRILFDPDLVNKIEANADQLFFRQLTALKDIFGVYFKDPLIPYAAALLVLEAEITDPVLGVFSDKTDDIKSFAAAEISLELDNVLKVKDNDDKPSLEKMYFDGVDYINPWLDLPNYNKISEEISQLTNTSHVLTDGHFLQRRMNASVQAMVAKLPDKARGSTLTLSTLVYSASKDALHDLPYQFVLSIADAYFTVKKQPCDIYLAGRNRSTRFQDLALHNSVNLHVSRTDGVAGFDRVSNDKVIVTQNPTTYINTLLSKLLGCVLIVDTADYKDYETYRSVMKLPALNLDRTSMDQAFNIVYDLLRKGKRDSPDEYHLGLPTAFVLRFIPQFGENQVSHKSLLNSLVHHYDIKYYPPVDFNGVDFTMMFSKRVKMLPKQSNLKKSPFTIFENYVYHAMIVRYGVLSGIFDGRFSWRSLAPIRMLSRYYGNEGTKNRISIQSQLTFANWGSKEFITDYSGIFGDVTLDMFNASTRYVQGSSKERRGRNKAGVSKLAKGIDVAGQYFSNSINYERDHNAPHVSKQNVNSPIFVKERVGRTSESHSLG